jgi:hypothetical protein
MNSNLSQLQKLISSSDLFDEQKEEFLDLFSEAKDEDLKYIVDLFKNDPSYIEKMYGVYRVKSVVFKNKDKKAWEKILQQEYRDLEKIEKSNL